MKSKHRKLTAVLSALALSAGLLGAVPQGALRASAASANWKFDFGNGGVEGGYTGVSASTGYDAGRGYGFSSGTSVSDVSASGWGAQSDAVQFNNSTPTGRYTFCADVPNGLYQVSVWLGNTTRTSVAIEGMYQIMNMTGNGAYHTLQVPVTDGQLNICACEGKAGYAFTMSALEIKQISSQTHTNPTIWICGDSTVCNYYPLANSDQGAQAGWAQLLPDVVDSSGWQVMNMATGGQYARGFVDAGQFTVIEKNGQPGDIYVISIGINDTNYSNETEYYNYVTDMVKRAAAKGMRVVLVKQQGRDGDITRNPKLPGRWYGGVLDTIGSEQGVQVIDLFNLWQNFRISINDTNPSPYYLSGDDLHINRRGALKIAEIIAEQIFDGQSAGPAAASFKDGTAVMFRNAESGMYLTAEDGTAAAGTNVSQSADASPAEKNTWKLVSAGENNEYYIYSMLDGGETYLLDVTEGKTENGTNMEIWTKSNSKAQIFKIFKDGGDYHIATAVSDYGSYVGIWGGSHEEKGNAIEWEKDGSDNQRWQIEFPMSAEDAPLLQGDLDRDGVLTAKDLAKAKALLLSGAQLPYNREQALDLNGDMQADAEDIALLADYLTAASDRFSDPKYAAAEQTISGGVREQTNAGYLYRDYLNLDNTASSAVTFTVRVKQKGNYLCTFHIANGSETDRKMMITVSGQSDRWLQSFLTTGSWTNWAERGLVLPLAAGINTITLQSNTSEGGPNIDWLSLSFTDEPVAEPYTGSGGQTGPVSDKPTVFIAADSTAQSYRESYKPQQGWGYYLQNYFTDNVVVSNHAIAGRSSKSFYDNGRLTTILDQMKTGDYMLIQFGINDGDSSKPERYAPVCGNADNPTDGSFEYYMTFYIKGALEKGGTPILLSPTLSIRGATQPFTVGYRNIDSACKMLAAKYNVPYYDFGAAMTDSFNRIDYNTVRSYYLGSANGSNDYTHFTETGADVVAGILASGIKGLNIDLSRYVK